MAALAPLVFLGMVRLGDVGKVREGDIVDSGIDRDHPRFRATTMDGSNEGNLVDPWYEDVAGHGTHIA